ncbi:helix-turn-helix domain-containing protein [Streptomyces lydicus]|uniref:helix-turn-helix domain-containing protein n=1 Tax=Streptomyces lydicus TaxID=47763 RepID=UPI0033EC3745
MELAVLSLHVQTNVRGIHVVLNSAPAPEEPNLAARGDKPARAAGRAVKRTVDLLRGLERLQHASNGRAVTLRALAQAAGLPRGTACRYLQDLVETGAMRQPVPGKGTYVLNWRAPKTRAQAHPSPWMVSRLTRLQGQTGQIALLFTPYTLSTPPKRLCSEIVWGTHDPVWHDALDSAPLDADAAGLVMCAAMDCWPRDREKAKQLHQIRENGYAIGPAPVDTHSLIAAPVMHGRTVDGAVAVMPVRHLMQSSRRRADCIQAVLEAAGAMSGHLRGPLRPAA